ncbi:MAG: mechanosensitive ion channel [Gemmatimonadota bacterium]
MIRRAAVPLLLLLGAASPLPAQQTSVLERLRAPSQAAGPAREEAEPESPPSAIPLQDVPRRLGTDLDLARRASGLLSRDAAEAAGDRRLAGSLAALDAILDNFDSLSLERLSASALREYEQALERERRRLERSVDQLATRADELESMQNAIGRSSEEWRLTRESLVADTLVEGDVIERVAGIASALDSVAGRLRGSAGRLIELGGEIAVARERLDVALVRLERMQGSLRRRLLVRDAPPLWDLGAVAGAGRPIVGDIAAHAGRDVRAFRESIDAGRHRVALHLLIFLATLLAVVGLRTRVREWPDEAGTDAARFVLGRPWAAAFLIALLATGWVYPHASMLVFELAFLASAVAVVRLVPAGVPAPVRRAVHALVLLAAVTRAAALLPPVGLARRVVLLAIAVLSLVLLLAIRQGLRERASPGRRGAWERLGGSAVGLAIPLLAASVLLNAAGWSDLAALLVVGTVTAAYLAVVLGLAAMVLAGIVRGLLVGPLARRSRAISAARVHIQRIAVGSIRLLAFLLWTRGALAAFGLDRALLGGIGAVLTREFSIGAVEVSLGRVALFGFVIWLAVQLGRIVKALLRDDLFPRLAMSAGRADAYATLAHWAILLAGILFAAASAGFGGSQLAVIAGALSLGIGFGLQNIVNNFVSGFILIFEQPIKAGDKIEIRPINLLGEVKRIGIRSSTIRTFDGADVIVPNSNVIQSEVVNWTLSDPTRRVQLDVGLAYGTPPEEVIRLLESVAKSDPHVLPSPEPFALFTGFGESSLDFRLFAWSATFDDSLRLRSRLAVAVERALREAGFEIPFPQRDLHLRSVEGRAAAALRDAGDPGPVAGDGRGA